MKNLEKALLELKENAWTLEQKEKINAVLRLLETDFKKIISESRKNREYKNYEAECENCQNTFVINKDQLLEYPANEYRSSLDCPICDSSVFTLSKVEGKKKNEVLNQSIEDFITNYKKEVEKID
jgi:Zn finger protein HypA/HybF involved in hydrogenase expression